MNRRYLNRQTALTFFASLTIAMTSSCTKGYTTTYAYPATSQSSQLQAPSATNVAIHPAEISDCAFGGSLVVVYTDLNGNHSLDSDEPILSTTKICNGAPGATGATGATGAQGMGSGISVTPAPVGACPAGGSVFKAFLDANNNGILDAGETITSVSTICNGTNGANGTDGESAHLTTMPATQAQCPNGGVVYTSSVGTEPSQQTVVCNGQDGKNASLQMGAVGPNPPGKSYSVCHHDYLYIPDQNNGHRGWLTFRHQSNGQADQGIGSTGFNVWNVDISDFLLVSEIGASANVTYCSLHWDPYGKALTYKVVDNTDGLAGLTGTIKF